MSTVNLYRGNSSILDAQDTREHFHRLQLFYLVWPRSCRSHNKQPAPGLLLDALNTPDPKKEQKAIRMTGPQELGLASGCSKQLHQRRGPKRSDCSLSSLEDVLAGHRAGSLRRERAQKALRPRLSTTPSRCGPPLRSFRTKVP